MLIRAAIGTTRRGKRMYIEATGGTIPTSMIDIAPDAVTPVEIVKHPVGSGHPVVGQPLKDSGFSARANMTTGTSKLKNTQPSYAVGGSLE